jgi:hypothetical protein
MVETAVLSERTVVSVKRLTMPWEVCPMGGPVLVITTHSDGSRQLKLDQVRAEDCDWI